MKYDDSSQSCNNYEMGIVGEAVDISTQWDCSCEIKADIIVNEFRSVRIWGQIIDCNGCPKSRVLLKLLHCDCGKLSSVAHTISDSQGFYQFDLCGQHSKGLYKIIAGRPILYSECDWGFPNSCCKNCESCQESNQEAILSDGLNNCRLPERERENFNENTLCRTCAYYDEETGLCCLKK